MQSFLSFKFQKSGQFLEMLFIFFSFFFSEIDYLKNEWTRSKFFGFDSFLPFWLFQFKNYLRTNVVFRLMPQRIIILVCPVQTRSQAVRLASDIIWPGPCPFILILAICAFVENRYCPLITQIQIIVATGFTYFLIQLAETSLLGSKCIGNPHSSHYGGSGGL